MQRTTLAIAVVAAVVFGLVGWYAGSKSAKVTFLSHTQQTKDCRGRDCDNKIKFDCVDPAHPTAATCVPYPEYDVLLVTHGKKIEFNIDSPADFKFDPTDGIKFTSANSGSFFPCQSQGPKKFKCDNNIPDGTPSDVYKYSIHVQGMNRVDPFVVNY